MKATHSKSLLLVWSVAEAEARRLGAEELDSAHFLIGLGKAVDVDWIEAVRKDAPDRADTVEEMLREMRVLREDLDALGLRPKALRRKLRSLLGVAQAGSAKDDRHRHK
jgi:hypothetical protein